MATFVLLLRPSLLQVWMVSGAGAVDGYPLPAVSGGTWSLGVSAVPMLIELQ